LTCIHCVQAFTDFGIESLIELVRTDLPLHISSGRSVDHPGAYATLNSYQLRDSTYSAKSDF
jgi:hypothetical protein